MNWLYYLAEANLYLCVFYLGYCAFLVKETHYQLNRAYLLLSCIAAFILPLLQIGALKPAITPAIGDTYVTTAVAEPAFYYYLWIAYVLGAVIILVFLVVKLYAVFNLTRTEVVTYGKYKMVYLKDTDVAFSFFNYLFIGTRAEGANTIITHELVHIRQKHSVDIMFLELLKAMCWFNPCIYLLQTSLKTVHEYIADEQTAATEADALTYSSFLVNNAYGAGGSSITHSFFNYNLLKKRIIMLNQQRSGKLTRLKYLVALPAFAGMLCASTLSFSKNYGWIDLSPAASKTKSIANNINFAIPAQDTTPKKRLSVPPKPKVDQVKFPPPAVKRKKTDMVKFPPRYEVDKKGEMSKLPPPPPEPPKPKVDQVKFPPKVDAKKLAPPPPEPPKPKVGQVKLSKKTYEVVKLSDVKLVQVPPRSKAKKVPTFEVKAKKTDVVKFPPRYVVGKNGELSNLSPPPPEPPKPKVDQVKFPPKRKIDVVKFPEDVVIGNNKETSKLPPPPPPEPPKPKN